MNQYFRINRLDVLINGMAILLLVLTSGLYVAFGVQVDRQLVQWNGAQLILERPASIPESWPSVPNGIASAHAVFTNTVVEINDQWLPVDIQAIDHNYPLVGSLELVNWQDEKIRLEPASVFVSSMFVNRYDHFPDSIEIGSKSFKLAGQISQQDEVGGLRFNFNPRILMTIEDLAQSGLWQAGSRVKHVYYFHGDATVLSAYEQGLKNYLTEHDVLRSPSDSNTWQSVGTDRVHDWYERIATCVWLLIVFAVYIWADPYRRSSLNSAKILSSFGISKRTAIWALIWPIISSQVFVAGVIMIPLMIFAYFLELPAHFYLVILGAGALVLTWIIMSLSFIMLKRPQGILAWLISLAFILSATFVLDVNLRNFFVYAFQEILILALVFYLMLFLLRMPIWLFQQMGSFWQYVALSIRSNQVFHAITIVVVSAVCISFLIINFTLSGLVARWQNDVPDGAPNIFLINVNKSDVESLKQDLSKDITLYPIVRGRIVAVGGLPMQEYRPQALKDPSFNRELNMTFLDVLPDHNQVVEGSWNNGYRAQVALEKDFAKRAGISLGDEIDISVLGQVSRLRVSAIRALKWQSLNPNFFVITSPDILGDYPYTFITSFHWADDELAAFYDIMRQYPNISVLNIDSILNEVKVWIQKLTYWVNAYASLLMLMVLVTALLVLSNHLRNMQKNRLIQYQIGISARHIFQADCVQMIINLACSFLISLSVFYGVDQLIPFGEGYYAKVVMGSGILFVILFAFLFNQLKGNMQRIISSS